MPRLNIYLSDELYAQLKDNQERLPPPSELFRDALRVALELGDPSEPSRPESELLSDSAIDQLIRDRNLTGRFSEQADDLRSRGTQIAMQWAGRLTYADYRSLAQLRFGGFSSLSGPSTRELRHVINRESQKHLETFGYAIDDSESPTSHRELSNYAEPITTACLQALQRVWQRIEHAQEDKTN